MNFIDRMMVKLLWFITILNYKPLTTMIMNYIELECFMNQPSTVVVLKR